MLTLRGLLNIQGKIVDQELRYNTSLDVKGQVWVRDVNLEVTGIESVIKVMKLIEITKGVELE